MKKKLLFVINTLGLAGAEVALISLLRAIPKEDYDVDLLVLMNQGELLERVPEHVNVLNRDSFLAAPIHSKEGAKMMQQTVLKALFAKGQIFKNFFYLAKNTIAQMFGSGIKKDKLLWKCLSDACPVPDKEYDAAIAYIEGGSTYFVADHVKAKKKISFVHISYEITGYTRALDHGCYEKIDQVYVVSDEVKNSFLKYYPENENKVLVFHNLIDVEGIKKGAADLSEYNSCSLWQDCRDFKLCTVGRLNYQKGYDMAVEALAILKEQGIKVTWFVVGDGELKEELLNQAKTLGVENSFVILGRKTNPYPYMANCDMYVQPSRFEGKSIAIEEAKCLCRPMVITRCDGNLEQLVHKENGLFCDMNASAIAQAIEELYKDKAMRERFTSELSNSKREDNVELKNFLEKL